MKFWTAAAAEPTGSGGLRPPSVGEPRSALPSSPHTPGGELACGKLLHGGQSPPLPVPPPSPLDSLRPLIATGLATRTHTVLGPEHLNTLTCRKNLAAALREQGRNAEAEAENRARISIEERVLGLGHPGGSDVRIPSRMKNPGFGDLGNGNLRESRASGHPGRGRKRGAARRGRGGGAFCRGRQPPGTRGMLVFRSNTKNGQPAKAARSV